jgi:S-adenosylmethionine decarboxylase
MIVGTEWLIEASGCSDTALQNEDLIREIFDRVIRDLGLKIVGTVWHKFPGEGGVTGMAALTESHLTCHTYPEYGTATFNLYCCRTRPEWDWYGNLSSMLSAEEVSVTKLDRGTPADDLSWEDAAA